MFKVGDRVKHQNTKDILLVLNDRVNGSSEHNMSQTCKVLVAGSHNPNGKVYEAYIIYLSYLTPLELALL